MKRNKINLLQKNLKQIFIQDQAPDLSYENQYFAMLDQVQLLLSQTQQQTNEVNEQSFNVLVSQPDGNMVPVSCIILKLMSTSWNLPASLAFIIRNREESAQKEREYQQAQSKIETLLQKILPPAIANKLMSNNDKLISKVEKATFMFIGIYKFTDWCKTHNHNEIMEMLDLIFNIFDRKIGKFKKLVKIKTINGVYMAAAGLFNEISEMTPEHEAVMFCYKCGKSLKKRKFLLHQDEVQLQIGVNTDGPIISGVLGIDKPVFDVWGDAVNVASRLETSSIPDTIQMSLQVKNNIPKGIFTIYERHDVFLKGKGNTTTYCIDLPKHNPKI